jgi:hypothetical protein
MRPSTFAQPDTGRMYWREPGEPVDERPLIRRRPFWGSVEEEAAYLIAVRNNPRIVDIEADTIESAMSYMGRISEIAEGSYVRSPVKRWPAASRPHREYTGPREPVTEGNLTFEDRTDAIYDRQPGEEG